MRKCGNNYHIKCLKILIDHKNKSGDKITCPMCCTDQGAGIGEEIRKDENEFNLNLNYIMLNVQVVIKNLF